MKLARYAAAVLIATAPACDNTTTTPPAPPVITFARISAGATHTCAISTAGDAYCWGQAGAGALGTDSVASSPNPTRVAVATGTYVDVDAGDGFTCAMRSTGQVDCWGRGTAGQLGAGQHANNPKPTPVGTALKFTRIVAGGQHTCALTAVGDPYCWGAGGRAQLGNGIFTDTAAPSLRVAYTHVYKTVGAGQFHACAITTDGTLRCWGWNAFGQLGNNTTIGLAFPEPVASDARFIDVSAGQLHTCALSTTNDVYCWGSGDDGQLGSGAFTGSLLPIRIGGGQAFTAKTLAAGARHTCALTPAGEAYCWGSNSDGQLGNGTIGGAEAGPVTVRTNLRFSSITAGDLHTCALTADGTAYCWGFGGFGQLGTGRTESSALPVQVAPGFSARAAAMPSWGATTRSLRRATPRG